MTFDTPQIVKIPGRPFTLDLSPDGSLLAVGHVTRGHSPPVSLYRTVDGTPVASLGKGFAGRAVAFGDAGKSLFYVVEEGSVYRLHRSEVSGQREETLIEYPRDFVCQEAVRDSDARSLALCGTSLEVWDTVAGKLIHSFPGAPEHTVRGAFCAQRKSLFTYGTRPGHAVEHALSDFREMQQLPAPRPFGRQVRISPSGRLLALVAEGIEGLLIYDLHAGGRFKADFFNESTFTALIAFSPDDRWLLQLAPGGLQARDLNVDTFSIVEGPRFNGRSPAALTTADAASLVALCWAEGEVAWLHMKGED